MTSRTAPLFAAPCLAAAVVLAGAAPFSCTQPETPAAPPAVRYKVQTVAEGLEVPWDLAFLPTGGILITERSGRVRLFDNGSLRDEPLLTVPDIRTRRGAEIGLMGICLHPDYAANKFVYLSYGSTEGDVRVVRFRHEEGRLVRDRLILGGFPAGANHAGCAIRFGPDGKLYISTGEAFRKELAQDMASLGGKVLRVNGDGSVPADNPFVAAEGARPEIWTLGNRNPQGIDWQPGSGLLFEAEHGPSVADAPAGGDEVNIIERGKNYGWPIIHHREAKEGLVSPLVEWTPAIAPGGVAFYNADEFPQWKGNLFVAALGGLRANAEPGLYRIVLDGRKYVSQERIAREFGRIRAVHQGPDGYIYLTTSNRDGRGRPAANDDRVLRLVPEGR